MPRWCAPSKCEFRCFIDDPQGYANDRWWEDLAERSVLPAARKFSKLHAINQKAQFPELTAIENAPRPLLAANDIEDILDDEDPGKTSHG